MSYQYFTRIAAVLAILVSACAPLNEVPTVANEKINISILAFNDLHGNLELPIISVREKINGELKDVQEVSV